MNKGQALEPIKKLLHEHAYELAGCYVDNELGDMDERMRQFKIEIVVKELLGGEG